MGATRTPRGKWIEEGLRALVAGGPEAVRVEVLAQVLGVSKGGIYGYFRNRDALLTEMLDIWEYEVAESVIEQVESGGGDARARLERLFAIVAEATDGPVRGTTADLAIREWARRDAAVAGRLRRVDNRRIDYLRSLFSSFCPDEDEVEVRCLIAVSVRIGNHLHAADNGKQSRRLTNSANLCRDGDRSRDSGDSLLDTAVVIAPDIPAGKSGTATARSDRKLSGDVRAEVARAVRYRPAVPGNEGRADG